MKRKAFTLIELLVVVAIIAVLVAILLPAISKAKNQAKSLGCQTNLRSYGQGFHQYGTDYRDWLPRFYSHLNLAYYGDDWILNGDISQGVATASDRRQWIMHGQLYGLGYLKVDFRKYYYCPVNNYDGCLTFWQNLPELMAGWCTKPTNYWYIGGLYTNQYFDARSKITDNSGRAIMMDADALFSGYHDENKINVLYLGGDVASMKSPSLPPQTWLWNTVDHQAKD